MMNNYRRFIYFDGWRFDLANDELSTPEKTVRLLETESRVLRRLAEEAGQDVRRGELLRLWNTNVTDNSLDQAVSGIRKAFLELGLLPEEIVKTAYGKGFRLIPLPLRDDPLVPLTARDNVVAKPASKWACKGFPLPFAIVGISLVILIMTFIWRAGYMKRFQANKSSEFSSHQEARCDRPPVRVLLATLNSDAEQKYKVTDFLRSNIREAFKDNPNVQIENLGRSIEETANPEMVAQIAKEHNATLLIWGFYVKTRDKVGVTLYLQSDIASSGIIQDRMVPVYPARALDRLEVHQDLSQSLTDLSRLVVAMVYFGQGDPRSAAQMFSAVLNGRHIHKEFVNVGLLYFYAALAKFQMGEKTDAVHLLQRSIPLMPEEARNVVRWLVPVAAGNDVVCPYPYPMTPAVVPWPEIICDTELAESAPRESAPARWAAVLKHVEQLPPDARRYQWEALIREKQGDVAGALQLYNKAISANACDANAYNARARLKIKRGDLKSAEDDYNASLSLAPWRSETFVSLGLLLRDEEKLSQASTALERAFDISPDASTLGFIANIDVIRARTARDNMEPYADVNRFYTQAAQRVLAGMDRVADKADAQETLAQIYEENQNDDLAIGQYKLVLSHGTGRNKNLYSTLACLNVKVRQYVEAQRMVTASFRFDSPSYKQFDCLSRLYEAQRMPFAAIAARRTAIDTLQRTIAESEAGSSSETHILSFMLQNLASLYDDVGLSEAALQSLDKAADLGPVRQTLYQSRALVYQHRGHLDRAKLIYDEGINKLPQAAQLYFLRAEIEVRLNQAKTAEADFNHVITLHPNSALAYRARARVDEMHRHYDTSDLDLKEAIRLEPADPQVYVDRIDFLMRRNEWENALSAIDEYLKTPMAYVGSWIYEAIALCDSRLQKNKAARQAMSKARSLSEAAPGDFRNKDCALASSPRNTCWSVVSNPAKTMLAAQSPIVQAQLSQR